MRFVHINHRYAPYVGGSERYMQEVSEMLARLGHSVTVLTSDAYDLEYFWDPDRRPVAAPSQEVLNGVDVRRIPVRHVPANWLVFQGSRRAMGEASRLHLPAWPFDVVSRRLPYMPGLAAEVRDQSPFDLLHVANVGIEGLALTGAREAQRMDIPLVVTPFVHLGTSDDSVARRYVSMPHQRKLLKSASSIVVMTQIEASFIKSLAVSEERIHITGVGIAPEEVTGGDGRRFRESHSIQGKLVGTAGALAFDKGTRELILGVGELRRRGHAVELALAGPILKDFERWALSLPAEAREGVHILGFIDPEEKRDMLAALDVLAMPSRTESFGIAYLEGWANGKPVLAARAGAVPELVQHGENGVLVEFGDHMALADEVLDLLADADRAQALGARGRAMTLERYTWGQVLTRVKGAYSAALGFELPEGDLHVR